METFSFVLFIVISLAELFFCLMRMQKPGLAVRMFIVPALILYYCCSTMRMIEPLILIALVFEALSVILASLKKIPSACSFAAGIAFAVILGWSLYKDGAWALAAPHYTYTVFLIHVTAVAIIIIKAYPLLTYPQLLRTSAELIYIGALSACAIVACIYSFGTRTGLLALGAFICFIHRVFRLAVESSSRRNRLGEFEIMLLYIVSRALIVIGARLPI